MTPTGCVSRASESAGFQHIWPLEGTGGRLGEKSDYFSLTHTSLAASLIFLLGSTVFWCPWFLCPFHFLPLTWPGGRSDFLLLLISELHHVPRWFLGSSITYVASSPYWHLSVLNTQNSICFQARHTNIGSVRLSALMLQAPHAILEILNSLPKTEY